MTITYWKDYPDNSRIYLERIDYTGNTGGLGTFNYVKFYLEDRTDAPPMFTSNFMVKTAKRLKTIKVVSNIEGEEKIVRVYKLEYDADPGAQGSQYSTYTGCSLLYSIQQYGRDAILDSVGAVTSGTAMPPTTILYSSTGIDFEPIVTDWHNHDSWGTTWKIRVGDFNGDGLSDVMASYTNDAGWRTYTSLSNGDGTFQNPVPDWHNHDSWGTTWKILVGDFNGDGLADITASYTGNSDGEGWRTNTAFSNGDGTFQNPEEDRHATSGWSTDWKILSGDYNGDGKTDLAASFTNSDGWRTQTVLEIGPIPDIVTELSSATGSVTTLEYEPSSSYYNKILPFIVQTLTEVVTDDGNGTISKITYDYSGGWFDYEDRSFWGFDYVSTTSLYNYDPGNGSCIKDEDHDYDCTISETWFNNDDIKYKGLPTEQRTSDSAGALYAQTEFTYDYTEPASGIFFPRLISKKDSVYDGTASPRASQIDFDYDSYGNITNKYSHGDLAVSGDERDEYTVYSPYDTNNWLVVLPKHTYVQDSGSVTKAQKWFTYEAGTGNLLTEESWLQGGTNPVTTYTYDSYGNVETITDPRNIVTKLEYGATYTFPEKVTNDFGGLGFFTQTTYDDIFVDKVHIETDYNLNQTRYDYDEFGRIKKITKPSPYGITEYTYDDLNKIKTVELKNRAEAVLRWNKTYYDGLGRSIKEESYGPDVTTIVVDTEYDERGLIYSTSNPYFLGASTIYSTIYSYDALGRLVNTQNPDDTSSSISYDRGWEIYTDENSHRRDVQKDIYDQIITVEEFTGYSEATYALYATTTYDYDVSGNLRYVTDNAGNVTEMRYDSLSRKTYMDDPDMGVWTYEYDTNGNLMTQTDEKGQRIEFDPYDALNRATKKNYPDGSYIQYTYDEGLSNNNAVGRLTTVTEIDSYGVTILTTKTYYDEIGQVSQTDRIIDGTTYTILTNYDVLERVESITYPDSTEINYTYDGHGNVKTISSGSTTYVTYNEYNAFAQPELVTYNQNGITTDYEYYSANNRLQSIVTTSTVSGVIMDLSYSSYDGVGNILNITDNLYGSRSRSYTYDERDRLTSATSTSYEGTLTYQYDTIGNMTYNSRYGTYFYEDTSHAHAVTRVEQGGQTIDSFIYDANGNMTSGAGRTLTYNYDNMPTSIVKGGTAAVAQYDAYGSRVKKAIPGSTTVYVDQTYECTDGVCTIHLMSGTQLLASISGTNTYYYHSDHLGSSSLITDSDLQGDEIVQSIYYYPYGDIQSETGDVTDYKFTGKEYDSEAELYYYGARYYDPKLARFISADTMVPLPFHPISLNRYAYTYNNPIRLIDLDGHEPWSWDWSYEYDYPNYVEDWNHSQYDYNFYGNTYSNSNSNTYNNEYMDWKLNTLFPSFDQLSHTQSSRSSLGYENGNFCLVCSNTGSNLNWGPTSGGQIRGPSTIDYFSLEIGLEFFVGGTMQFSLTRYGDLFFNVGPSGGVSFPISGSLTAGVLMQNTIPSRYKMNKYFMGDSSLSVADGAGMGTSYTFSDTDAWNVGFYSPQIGAAWYMMPGHVSRYNINWDW